MANHASSPTDYVRVPSVPQGGTHNDSGAGKLLETSLEAISEEDKKWMIDAWIDDANGILAFTGLLAATIGAFIIEFYKKLSPDSGGQTVDLLGQISQQLTNPSNGVVTAADQSFSPNVYLVWVIGMWLISLVFSLTSALITALNQQAVRRYVETPEVPGDPSDKARVHLKLFQGRMLYKMRLATLAGPALLHLAIFLFFGGLVIAFHTVYEKVAIALDVAVGVSGLVYMAMSLIPLLDLKKCPYRTPITYILWYLWNASPRLAKRYPACSCLCPPCTCTCPGPLDSDGSDGSDGSDKPDDSDGAGSGKHYIPELPHAPGKAYLTDDVINGATNQVEDEDRKTITWLFKYLSLGDKNKFLVFAAAIPRHKVIDLIPPTKSGKIVLRQPLLVLLQSCMGRTDDTGAVGPGEAVRKDALFVCLTAIHHIAEEPSIPDLNFVRGEFANINIMRVLWDDRDDSIRITSRSICALVARQVIRKRRLGDADLGWLQDVTGQPSDVILEADIPARDRMNVRSFVRGTLPNPAYYLSNENATSFDQTLAIILPVDERADNLIYFTNPDWQARLFEEIERIQQHGPEGGHGVYERSHPMSPSLPAALPAYPEELYTRRDTTPYFEVPADRVQAPIRPRAELSTRRDTTPYFEVHADRIQAPIFPRAELSSQAETPIFPRPAPSFQAGTPGFPRATTSYRAEDRSFPRAETSFQAETPNYTRTAPTFQAESPNYTRPAPTFQAESPNYTRPAPTFQAESPNYTRPAPTFQADTPNYARPAPSSSYHTEAPGFPPSSGDEAPLPPEARIFVRYEEPSFPEVPSVSEPRPRPRRAARFSQATSPPLVPPSPRVVSRTPTSRHEPSPIQAASSPDADSPPGIISPSTVPPSPIIPSRPSPLPHRAAHSSEVTRRAVHSSQVTRRAGQVTHRAAHSSQVTPSPLVAPSPQTDPPPITSAPRAVPHPQAASSESPPVVHPTRAGPPPRAVFPAYAAPPPRAAPSSALPPPSAPPTPPVASSSRITRQSHTARPPHAPI